MSVPQDPIVAKARRILNQPEPVPEVVKPRELTRVPRGMMRLGEADPTLSELKALAQARRKFVEEMAAKQPAAQLRDAMLEQHAPVPFDEFCEVVKDPGKASLELERARQRLEKNPGSAVRITPGIAQLVERRAKHPDWTPTPTGWGLYLASLAPALKEHLDALRRDALFPEAARQEHTLIVAPTGHGKSTLLKALIHHYVAEAPGSAVIVLDPGGDLVRQVARWPELIQGDRLVYIEPELKPGFTVGLNPLDGRGLDERGQNHVAAALARALGEVVNELTDNMRTLVRTTATLLLGTPGATLRDMQVLLRQSAATAAPKRRARVRPGPGIELPPETAVQGDERAAELLALGREHPDEEVADFFASEFEGEYFAPTRNSMAARLRNVLSLIDVRNMMTGPATVHLESLIDARRVILVNLARFGDDGSAMVGRLLVALVAGLVRRRADLPEGARRVPVQLFVDEVTTMVSPQPEYPNHVWSYDFVEDRTHNGRKFRMLNVIDEYTRECLAIRIDRKLNSTAVIDVLSDLFVLRGVPGHVRSDNGPEFMGLSGISCAWRHTGPYGGSQWHDAKLPVFLTLSWTSFWPAPIPRRPLTATACWTI